MHLTQIHVKNWIKLNKIRKLNGSAVDQIEKQIDEYINFYIFLIQHFLRNIQTMLLLKWFKNSGKNKYKILSLFSRC